MDYNLKGKTAIITGAAKGLGKAIALNLAKEGVNTAINYNSNREKAEETAAEIISSYGVKAAAIQADVTNEDDVTRLFRQAADTFGAIDILVNNSAVCPITMVCDMAYAEWEQVIKTNLSGTFLTCREMVRYLIGSERKGNIVNVASQAAYNGSKRGKSHYAASKGGVISFTTSLAREVAHLGIRVNAVAPGLMYTEMTAGILDTPEKIAQYNNQIPIGRIATPDDVARIAVFLAGDASNYMTGATLDASGGMTGR